MKRIQHIKQLLAVLCLIALVFSCKKEDPPVIDNTLTVLSQKINGVKVSNGVANIKTAVSIELIFSHTLKTASFESALSFTGPSGAVPFDLTYSNTNSTVTLVNTAPLDNEATYTITVAPGTHAEGGQELRSAFTLSFTTQPFIPANVVLSADVSSISEAGGVATLKATLSEKVDKDVTVNLAFGGSASG
ncbi:MAG: Ig-like domain-containing protein [Lewinellaceae bacterium]|nr:Ig-like domain-containing protein [Lewinellaceae bacterium]